MANKDIRGFAKERGVFLWQVAEKYGLSDGNLSRKLRRELPDFEKEKLRRIITEISSQEV